MKKTEKVTLRICFKIYDLESFVTMWGTFVLATSNMAASAIALAASNPMAPLFDRSSSTTLDEKNGVSLKSLDGVWTVAVTWGDFRSQLPQMTSLVIYCMAHIDWILHYHPLYNQSDQRPPHTLGKAVNSCDTFRFVANCSRWALDFLFSACYCVNIVSYCWHYQTV